MNIIDIPNREGLVVAIRRQGGTAWVETLPLPFAGDLGRPIMADQVVTSFSANEVRRIARAMGGK